MVILTTIKDLQPKKIMDTKKAMNIKHHFYLLLYSFIIAMTPLAIHAHEEDFDIFNNTDINLLLDNDEFSTMTRAVSDSDIVELLINLNAVQLLEQQLFLHTHPLNQRNLVDSPLYLPQHKYTCPWIVGTHVFWNQLDRAFFNKTSSSICSYLAINNPEILQIIESSPDTQKLFAGFDINPLQVLPLFSNMTIQERQFGLAMYAFKYFEHGRMNIFLPFFYMERNFFLNECEQEAIEDVLGQTCEDDKDRFAKNHLISDKLGFGDTRINIDFNVSTHPTATLLFGPQFTIPTAFAVAKGMLGSSFKRTTCRPTIDLAELITLGQGSQAQKEQAFTMAQNFFRSVLNNLSANLIETQLGNGGHFGVGVCLNTQVKLSRFIHLPWAEPFQWWSRMSLEYLFPKTTRRSFVECSNEAEFAALGLNRPSQEIINQAQADPVYAATVLAFLETKIVDQLIPFAFCTRVSPGFIFRSTSRICYDALRWAFYLGTDTWIQTQEKLSNIKVVQVNGDPSNINVRKATAPSAYQSKFIGSVEYKVLRPTKEWTVGLNGDLTVLSSGIGQDFTISLNFDVNF